MPHKIKPTVTIYFVWQSTIPILLCFTQCTEQATFFLSFAGEIMWVHHCCFVHCVMVKAFKVENSLSFEILNEMM